MQTENLQNISPALLKTPTTQMSSKEFQRMLYTWFEEKGLVSDLRSYLRVLMIKELRNTTVGKIDHNKANFSLSKQAFSLVIAEHLLREGCHYTLSIFSTEVPGVASQLPFSLFEAHCHDETWRFDQDSLLNVLELIGISKTSTESLRIAGHYFRNQGSLLSCLVNSKIDTVEVSNVDNGGDYLGTVLRVLGVSPSVEDVVRKKIEGEVAHGRPTERQIEELQAQISERNNQIGRLMEEQLLYKRDNKKLKNELKDTRKRLNQAILQEQSLNLRETQIEEKLEEVARLQRELEKAFGEQKVETCLLKHCTESCHNTLQRNEELREEISRLERVNQEKTTEIQRLNSKLNSLTKDLHNSRLNIDFLNTCLVRSSQINLQQGQERDFSSDEPSENLTGEVLKQVRSKLRELERESDELDVKFKRLKMK